jgi:hypothetical protein
VKDKLCYAIDRRVADNPISVQKKSCGMGAFGHSRSLREMACLLDPCMAQIPLEINSHFLNMSELQPDVLQNL